MTSANLVYADPPWRYGFSRTKNREIENQYPTMTVPEIIAAAPETQKDAILFLWATSPKLIEALTVMEGWGFDYKTCMIWAKDKIGMGYYARQQHELLLIGKKGTPSMPLPANRPPSVQTYPRTRHSAKPHEFYDLIEQMFPHLTDRLEMFARNTRPGWTSWGNDPALEDTELEAAA